MRIDRLDPLLAEQAVPDLARILVRCVEGGASVGFLAPLAIEVAAGWWSGALAAPSTLTWVARDDQSIHGVVQLKLAELPNGLHRAEVAKLLVDPAARGRGIGGDLLGRLEADALALGRTLLLLDTQTRSPAESLYERRGWTRFGVVDGHAVTPGGVLAPTTYMYKQLR